MISMFFKAAAVHSLARLWAHANLTPLRTQSRVNNQLQPAVWFKRHNSLQINPQIKPSYVHTLCTGGVHARTHRWPIWPAVWDMTPVSWLTRHCQSIRPSVHETFSAGLTSKPEHLCQHNLPGQCMTENNLLTRCKHLAVGLGWQAHWVNKLVLHCRKFSASKD